MKTKMTDLFGIQYPIMCGPMLHICDYKMCAAVSEAGALGNLTSANYNNGEELRTAIHKVREITSKPFSVNITLMPSIRLTDEILDDFFRVCAEERVPAVDVSGALAVKHIEKMHDAGVRMLHKVGAVRHAKSVERAGYDAVIAAGFEEGGFPLDDDVTTAVLTPRICDNVNIPVITTGGVADGRGLAAALALGASGIMMATRFIATQECAVHANIKAELVQRKETDTTLICKTLNMQGRALKNRTSKDILECEAAGAANSDIFKLMSGARSKIAWENGDVDGASFMVGQSIGLIYGIPTIEEMVLQVVQKAKEIIQKNLSCY